MILTLCRLLACYEFLDDVKNSQKWTDLALYRFEGVSDSDLLELYVPLLQTSLKIMEKSGRSKQVIEEKLAKLQREGVKVTECGSLMNAVNKISERVLVQVHY